MLERWLGKPPGQRNHDGEDNYFASRRSARLGIVLSVNFCSGAAKFAAIRRAVVARQSVIGEPSHHFCVGCRRRLPGDCRCPIERLERDERFRSCDDIPRLDEGVRFGQNAEYFAIFIHWRFFGHTFNIVTKSLRQDRNAVFLAE